MNLSQKYEVSLPNELRCLMATAKKYNQITTVVTKGNKLTFYNVTRTPNTAHAFIDILDMLVVDVYELARADTTIFELHPMGIMTVSDNVLYLNHAEKNHMQHKVDFAIALAISAVYPTWNVRIEDDQLTLQTGGVRDIHPEMIDRTLATDPVIMDTPNILENVPVFVMYYCRNVLSDTVGTLDDLMNILMGSLYNDEIADVMAPKVKLATVHKFNKKNDDDPYHRTVGMEEEHVTKSKSDI